MEKVLFIATVESHILCFHVPFIKYFQDKGYEVHVATKLGARYKELEDINVVTHDVSFERSIFSKNNIKAYYQLKKVMKENKFKLVHTHTPIASFIGRYAAKVTNTKNVIYTAHGFHFFKGAPLKNWLLYYPAERLAARWTDCLITINSEDYEIASNRFKTGRVEYVPGVGIDTEKFNEIVLDKSLKRKELGIPDDAFLVLSVGELNKNKNHETIIKAIAKLNNPNVYYIICGQGVLENYLKDLINELGLQNNIKLLGYRRDIAEISKVSDMFVFPSFREGLSVALMEAMALRLPVVCSNIRGNVDLIKDGKGGYLVEPNDVFGFVYNINKIIEDAALKEDMGKYNKEVILKFDIGNVKKDMEKIYLKLNR
ncbi:glycosyltransferase family 4 protein [Clostridium sporogenes]|uniref:glycosyltransferase family 4 protein n=1 Tax=Clostridium sporogenes TaxID=1509 RepID=UPI00313CF383